MLVLKQANPCAEWYEGLLVANEHYAPVDGSYSNLSAAIAWARAHDNEAQAIASRGHDRIRQVVSVKGIYTYVDALIAGYARAYRRASHDGSVVGSYTHEFACKYSSDHTRTECKLARIRR